MEDHENIGNAAEQASEAAFEFEIAEETREFLRGLSEKKVKSTVLRPLYIASIAASLLILIVATVTINVSHTDHSIASRYGINALVARSGNNVNNDDFRDAVRAYYAGDYNGSAEILNQMNGEMGKVQDYKEWLSLLITLQTSGSQSETFYNQLNIIVMDESHEFYQQANLLKQDVDLFWRKLIIRK